MNSVTLVPAPLSKRFISFLIDNFSVALLVLIIFSDQITQMTQSIPPAVDRAVYQENVNLAIMDFMSQYGMYIVLLEILYQAILIGYNGMTLGKYLTKTKVVSIDGSSLNYGESFLRASVRVVSQMVYGLGFLLAFFTPKKQTLHGLLSRSIVVGTDVT